MDIRVKTFTAEAIKRLDFLQTEYNYGKPEVNRDNADVYLVHIRVRYLRDDRAVETSLALAYAGEEYVTTSLARFDNTSGAIERTDLATTTAHTGYQMRLALDRHTKIVHDLLRAEQHQT